MNTTLTLHISPLRLRLSQLLPRILCLRLRLRLLLLLLRLLRLRVLIEKKQVLLLLPFSGTTLARIQFRDALPHFLALLHGGVAPPILWIAHRNRSISHTCAKSLPNTSRGRRVLGLRFGVREEVCSPDFSRKPSLHVVIGIHEANPPKASKSVGTSCLRIQSLWAPSSIWFASLRHCSWFASPERSAAAPMKPSLAFRFLASRTLKALRTTSLRPKVRAPDPLATSDNTSVSLPNLLNPKHALGFLPMLSKIALQIRNRLAQRTLSHVASTWANILHIHYFVKNWDSIGDGIEIRIGCELGRDLSLNLLANCGMDAPLAFLIVLFRSWVIGFTYGKWHWAGSSL